ncbi:MAG: hypothetical protein PHW18_00970 [Sulfuricurvum sp.]|uniref:DUF6781 family protein n=1 Tax=Sulfuricurvum sp. TaxID=2025608 RepID=UPI0026128217|nr:DUF6781 family protein [Sulfuricurvum sp.]MDD2828125.1 hypothetical protein [Sulfuricurvum sp.]MDD4948001.1 hypothetical protein [Sulfuricurvum sp.]
MSLETFAQQFSEHNMNSLSMEELKTLTTTLVKNEAETLHNELEDLLEQKEKIERQISRKSEELQHLKYQCFEILEKKFSDDNNLLEKLHQIKIQSVDLLDILEEMVESAIITTLEKSSDIEETLHEIIKEITYQTLNANVLNAVRIRKIFSSILQSALNVAEATPNQAEPILRGTLLGIRSALHKSIEKFRQYLLYVPDEIRALYHKEYQMIEDELEQIHTLFGQIVHGLSKNNSSVLIEKLTAIGTEIRLDSDELSILSQETAKLLQGKLSKLRQEVTQRSAALLNSQSAKDAKAMGKRAWSVAKSTMEGALKSAKEAMDKK